MKAHDLLAHLRGLNGGWIKLDQTVDTFKAGDPDAEVRGIAVGWMSYTWALRRAVELGCNVFITHEPTYYDHLDNNARMFALPGVQDKRRFIEQNGLVVLRCHDLWDQYPNLGIPDSWGEWLGLGWPVASESYFRVYDVGGRTALDVARQVAARVSPLGQQAVELVGPADQVVTRACIGTGAITPFQNMLAHFGADLLICTDDGFTYWRDGAYAIDMNVPVIVVNHAVSEEAGLTNLAQHLREQFPGVPVHHIPQRCMYQLVGERMPSTDSGSRLNG
jgi:putative NIF3 family GTP cyclohydrolase 1 type 2